MSNAYSLDPEDSDPSNPLYAKKRAANYLASIGLSPSILDMVPNFIGDEATLKKNYGQAGAFYEPSQKKVVMQNEFAQAPQTWLHEYFHALQSGLSEADKSTLNDLIAANPPEGSGGFTNYPQGQPSQHHNASSGWGLASYIDYNYESGFQPYAEQFRTTQSDNVQKELLGADQLRPAKVYEWNNSTKPWWNMPKPVLDFLKERFPYNPSTNMRQGGARNRTTASVLGNAFGYNTPGGQFGPGN